MESVRPERTPAVDAVETRLRMALDAGRMVIWDMDVPSGTFSVSENARELLGMTGKPGDWTFHHFLDRVHPEDRGHVASALTLRVGDQAVPDYRFRVELPDGNMRWFETHATVVERVDGQPSRIFGATLDITEQEIARTAERTHAVEMELLFEIAQGMAVDGSFGEKMQRLAERLASSTGESVVTLRVPDADGMALRLVAAAGPLADIAWQQPSMPAGTSFAWAAHEQGVPVVVHEIADNPLRLASFAAGNVHSVLAIPIRQGSRGRAVLVVSSTEPARYTEERVRFFATVANGILPLIESARLEQEAKARSRQLEIFAVISSALAQRGTFEEKIRVVLAEVARAVEASVATMRVPNSDGVTLRILGSAGNLGSPTPDPSVRIEDSIAGIALKDGRLAVIDDYPAHPLAKRHQIDVGTRSVLVIPVRAEGSVIGVISVLSSESGHFTPERVQLLSGVADSLGPVLENTRLQEAQRLSVRDLGILLETTRALASTGTFTERAIRVAQGLAGVITGAAAVTLRIPDPKARVLRLVAAAGQMARFSEDRREIPFGQGISGDAFSTGLPQISNDESANPRAYTGFTEAGVMSVAALPIVSGGLTQGVLVIASTERGFFTEQRIQLVNAVAEVMGPLFENARHQEEDRLRTAELETIGRVARLLAEPGPFDERATRAMDEVAVAANVTRAILRVADEGGAGLRLVAAAGASVARVAPDPVVSRDLGAVGAAYRSGDPLILNNYAADDVARPERVLQGIKFVAVLPVKVAGRSFGLITVSSDVVGHFTADRIRLLTTVADGMGALLDNARLQGEIASQLTRERQRLIAVTETAGRLAIAEQPETAFQQVIDTARALMDADFGAIALSDPNDFEGPLNRFIVSGLSPDERDRIGPPPTGHGLLAVLREGGGIFRSAEISREIGAHGFPPQHPHMRSFVGVPIQVKGTPVGAIYVAEKSTAPEFTVEDERLIGLFAVLTGIFLENAELYAEQARERMTLAAIQQSMAEGLLVVDHNGRILYLNEAAAKPLGLDTQSFIGESLEDSIRGRASATPDPSGIEDLLDAVRHPSDDLLMIDVAAMDSPGRVFTATVFSIPTPTDRLTGVLLRDVTEERGVARRRDALIAVASHELRTPLTSIVGFAELLLNDDDRPVAVRRAWLNYIHQGGQRLATIIEDLLDVSRIQTGRMTVALDHVSVRAAIDEAIRDLGQRTDRHRFVVSVAEPASVVVADRAKVVQVLVNLVGNAVKYSPAGGTVTVSANRGPQGDHITISVSDDGIGIGPADRTRLFETFERIQTPETAGIGGTGLGLYISKNLVELMDGTLSLESELGRGSTFSFTLPVHPSSELTEHQPEDRQRRKS